MRLSQAIGGSLNVKRTPNAKNDQLFPPSPPMHTYTRRIRRIALLRRVPLLASRHVVKVGTVWRYGWHVRMGSVGRLIGGRLGELDGAARVLLGDDLNVMKGCISCTRQSR